MVKRRRGSMVVNASLAFIVVSLVVALVVAWVIKSNVEKQIYTLLEQSAEGVVNLTAGQVYIAGAAGDFYLEKAKEHARDKIKGIVDSAYASVENLYNMQEQGLLTASQAKERAKEFLSGIRYDNGAGYIFAMDTNYVTFVHANKSVIGKNMKDLKDPEGKPFLRELVDGAVKNGSVFVEYKWTKPGQPEDKYFPKIAYARYFQPWGWVIGTGDYIDDVYNDVDLFKKQMYIRVGKSISSFRLLNAYPFVMDKDGYLVIHPKYDTGVEFDRSKQILGVDKKTGENIGQKAWALMEKTGKKVVKMDYYYTKPGQGEEIYKKLGFFYKIPGTDLIAAFSFYEDDMKAVAMSAVMPTMGVLAVFTLILILLMWYILRYRVLARLKVVQELSDELAAGNLAIDIHVKGNDEITAIVERLDGGIAGLREMIKGILHSAEILKQGSDELVRITREGMNTLDDMVSSFGNVRTQMMQASSQVRNVSDSAVALQQSADEVANAATNLSTFGSEVTSIAREGQSAIENVIGLVQDTEFAVKDAEALVDRLAQRSEGISEIVGTISDIAEQTNLLALNAAIEAARAGEAGRGFAVVADEIRKLAENTQESVQKIAEILSGIREDAESVKASTYGIGDSVRMVREASEAAGEKFENIVSKIVEMNTQVESLAAISEEQSATTAEVRSAIEEVASLIQQVDTQVETLSGDVDRLKEDMAQIERAAVEFTEIADRLYKDASKFKV